jgi:predicted nucleic acid-binding protein
VPINIVWSIDKSMVKCAGMLKTSHKLSYADCFAGALTILEKARLATTDRREFEPVEKTGVLDVYWLR